MKIIDYICNIFDKSVTWKIILSLYAGSAFFSGYSQGGLLRSFFETVTVFGIIIASVELKKSLDREKFKKALEKGSDINIETIEIDGVKYRSLDGFNYVKVDN